MDIADIVPHVTLATHATTHATLAIRATHAILLDTRGTRLGILVNKTNCRQFFNQWLTW